VNLPSLTLSRLWRIFFIFFACVLSVQGQEVLLEDNFGNAVPPVFAPLEGVELDFPVAREPGSDLEQPPALQPDFVAPPLPEEGFSARETLQEPVVEAILRLDAHLASQSLPLSRGIIWRIFSAEIGLDDKLPLIETKQGGMAEFRLPEGEYFVHAAFGRASVSKRLSLQAGRTYYENIDLDAGGLMLNVETEGNINKNRVHFSIYRQADDSSPQLLIVEDVKPDTVVRLKAGDYHIISTYGDANALASADIRVEAGKLTQATIEHHAAQVTLKLVREVGGEALADTSWVIMNASGDTVREIANPHVDIVLVEGDYIAYARNKEHSYAREFSVSPGQDAEIDLLMSRDGVEADAG